jgi:hypothetical protein
MNFSTLMFYIKMELPMNCKTFLNFLILATLALMLLPSSAFCELKSMDDEALSDTYAAAGFTNFTIEELDLDGNGIFDDNVYQTTAFFKIRAETYTTIDSMKLGYHQEYDYKDPDPSTATWDEDWVNVYIGDKSDGGYYDPTLDFLAGAAGLTPNDNGFYFKAIFDDINNPSGRKLKSISFGATYVKGDISALFNSFSGTINDGVGAPEYNGHILNLGQATITADPGNTGVGGFDISLSIDNYDKGYWVTFDNAIVTPGLP